MVIKSTSPILHLKNSKKNALENTDIVNAITDNMPNNSVIDNSFLIIKLKSKYVIPLLLT